MAQINGAGSVGHTYPARGSHGQTLPVGSVTMSNMGTTISTATYGAMYPIEEGDCVVEARSQLAELPEMTLMSWDENENEVQMTLTPEASITSSDALKIFMLVMAVSVAPDEFCALAYVKKNNLERHFKYS